MTENHEFYIRKVLELAALSIEHKYEPFSALLVCDDQIVLADESTSYAENDVTRHAELNLISKATRTLDRETLSRCTLYSSTEPCAMCSVAIYRAGIPRVVYSCPSAKLGEIRGSDFDLYSREVFARGKRHTEVIGPVLEEEGIKIHLDYLKSLAENPK